ncbi:MAG: response regulator [Chitinophagales bacterium]|nr:response regulator [Bacteroidota bacterium]MBP7399347.1 response regulator [Chitinophagales bacterium]MBP9188810.1 response regulator [Chitinophagales bacterium]MBP9547796.1 response regulator [Chitinophagales bacterium]MBP9704124.1 response regulator [Chitinophagales bacterium]
MEEKNPMNILLVEDNPADARLVEIYLSESTMIEPMIMKTAELGKGLLMLEEHDFDVVLLDLTLPDSSGFSTIKTMLDEFPEQTVIVMTGLEDETVALNSVKAGAQDFIVKGQFDSNLLSRTITYAIERHQLQRRLEDYAKAIKLNEQRLLEAQKMARIGNWEMDIVTNGMFWSEEVFRILGVKENSIEPTLNDFMKLVVSDDRDTLKTSINRAMEKGQSFLVEYSINQKDGSSKRLACQGQVQMSKKTSGLCLVGTIQDISSFGNRSNTSTPVTIVKNKLDEAISKLRNGNATSETLALLDEAVNILKQI